MRLPSWIPLVFLAALAGVLRALPLLVPHGAQATADFDEGVYLAAAGLLSEGRLPYEDFTFLHPPGLLLLAWPLTAAAPGLWGWDDVLVAGRWLGVAVGVVNVVLLAVLVSRWRGRTAGLVAGALYAGYRPAVAVEQHLLLEPFVVLGLLLAAAAWLTGQRTAVRVVGAGAAVAVAGVVKLTGGLVLLALLVSARPGGGRERWQVVGVAAGVAALLALPFLLLAGPAEVVRQVVLAQVRRPGGDVEGGSVLDPLDRLVELGRLGPLGAVAVPGEVVLLALVLLAAAAVHAALRGGRDGRFWAAALPALLLPAVLAPDWYTQYPVPAAVAACALAGGAVGAVVRTQAPRTALLLTAAVALLVLAGLADTARDVWRDRPAGAVDTAAAVRSAVPEGACLVGEPPHLALAAGRLPVRDASGSYLVDPFGALLVEALDAGATGSTPDLLDAPAAQERLRAALLACPYVLLGSSDLEQLARFDRETAVLFDERFDPVPTLRGDEAVLWRAVG